VVNAVDTVSGEHFAATTNAPGGTTATDAVNPVPVANFGPTLGANLGSGTFSPLAEFERALTGVLTVGTHVLGRDCVFAANSLG
jgi:hypothetical protein